MRRAYAQTPFGQIHYREAGSGPPIVLLHQTPLSGSMFDDVLPHLARQFRAIAPDTPGYGNSAGPDEPPGMSWYAAAFLAFLDALDIEQTALIGVHTGASIAVEIAATQPQRITHLILNGCPDYEPATRQEKIRGVGPVEPAPDGSDLSTSWEQAVSGHWGGWATPEQIERGVIDRLSAGRNMSFATLAVFQQDVRERIPSIQADTLLLACPGDPFYARQPLIAPLFRIAQEQVIPDGGPLPVQKLPEQFAQIVATFINRG